MKNLFAGPGLILFGIILLFFGFFSSKDGDFIQTRAVVINNVQEGELYTPILQYQVDGVTYEEEGIPEEEESILGSEVMINYNPENPSDFNIGSGSPMLFYIFGVLFILFGIFSLMNAMRYFNHLSSKTKRRTPIMDEIPNEEIYRDGKVTTTIKSNKPITDADIDRINERIEKLKNMPESEGVTKITKTYKSDKPLTKEEIESLKEEFIGNKIEPRDDFKYTYTETRNLTDEELEKRNLN